MWKASVILERIIGPRNLSGETLIQTWECGSFYQYWAQEVCGAFQLGTADIVTKFKVEFEFIQQQFLWLSLSLEVVFNEFGSRKF